MSTLVHGIQEDGIVRSSDIAKFDLKTYKKHVVEFGQNAFPLNLYSDDPALPHIKFNPDDKE